MANEKTRKAAAQAKRSMDATGRALLATLAFAEGRRHALPLAKVLVALANEARYLASEASYDQGYDDATKDAEREARRERLVREGLTEGVDWQQAKEDISRPINRREE